MASEALPPAGGGATDGGSAAATAAAAAASPPHPLPFRLLPTGTPTDWDPASAEVTLNVRLDGCIVPSEASAEGARIAYSHAVVIDDLVDEATRQQLLDFLLYGAPSSSNAGCTANGNGEGSMPGGSHCAMAREQQGGGAAETAAADAAAVAAVAEADAAAGRQYGGGPELPPGRWERRTADMAGGAPTWGVKQHVLAELAAGSLPAMQEVHARLRKLYPECEIAHLPSDAIQLQQQRQAEQQQQQQDEEPPSKRSRQEHGGSNNQQAANGAQHASGSANGAEPRTQAGVDCACFVANAAVAGDSFRFHVDADPTSFPDGSPWHAAYGDYFNGEPGRPLLVSLLLYLNPEWERDWGADTLFLDGATDTGIFVAPKPRRAVLFDQDILHRVSAPLASAAGRPRFSLVWKLAFLPRRPGQALCLARPEWGPPVSFGSAARVDAVKRRLAAERAGR